MALPVRQNQTLEARRDPIHQFSDLSHQLTRLLDEQWPELTVSDVFTPLADVEETDDAYLVDVELPGVKKNDLNVEVTDRRVVVSGERREKERVGLLRRRTRTWGRFQFEINLPEPIDEDKIEANLDDGVLSLRIPKATSTRRRQIDVS
jgi:HSP20 family protein